MKQRIITGVIAAIGFLAILYLGDYVFHGLLWLMALIAFDELVRMSKTGRTAIASIVGYFGVAIMVLPWNQGDFAFGLNAEVWIWLCMLLLMTATVASKNKTPIDQSAILLFGVVYIGMGFHYMATTRWHEDGLLWTLLIFLCIWITDAGAYFTGWAIGKHPLWPSISPKKTVEGAMGGLILSIAAAICFAIFSPELISLEQAALLGICIGIVGQVGDLIQSAYKRTFGVKDSGTLLPGHGGVLDRTDSWLIVFPFVYLILNVIS
ncbi:MAG: phosphatidate cytidylyltransferase [Paenibacillaceae bacterium]